MTSIKHFNFNVHNRLPRLTRIVCGLVAVVVVVGGLYMTQSPEHHYGRARYILVEGAPLVGEPSTGKFMALSYSSGAARLTEWASNPFGEIERAPRAAQDFTYGDVRDEQDSAGAIGADLDILRSVDQAWSAANFLIDRPVDGEALLIVDYAFPEGPAKAAGLRKEDRILAVNNGEEPATTVGLNRAVSGGNPVTLEIVRNGEIHDVTIQPVLDDSYGTARYTIGVKTSPGVRITGDRPFVAIPSGTTGPSAGLMYTLSLLDAITPGDLTGGLAIAGTGTIEPNGSVGEIGGVRYKVSAVVASHADVMFIDDENYEEAMHYAPADLEVVPTVSLSVAVRWLCEHGGTSTACAHVFFGSEVQGLPDGFEAPVAPATKLVNDHSPLRGGRPPM